MDEAREWEVNLRNAINYTASIQTLLWIVPYIIESIISNEYHLINLQLSFNKKISIIPIVGCFHSNSCNPCLIDFLSKNYRKIS